MSIKFLYLIKKGLKVSKVDLRFGKIFLCEIVDVDHFLKKYLKISF